MEERKDALRELFSGLGRDKLATEAATEIMARVGRAKQPRRHEDRFEWIVFGAFVAVLAAGIVVIRHVWPDAADLLPDMEISETLHALSAVIGSPLLLIVAGCTLLLLFLDRAMRKRYDKKHFT